MESGAPNPEAPRFH